MHRSTPPAHLPFVASRQKSTVPPRPTLSPTDLRSTYLKGSGPGGQKINKTNSAVQMTHLPTGIVVKSQATRSRTQNFNIAKRILAEKVEVLEKGGESRRAKIGELKAKRKGSAEKKKRRKYRRLEGMKGSGAVLGLEDGEREDDGGEVEKGDTVIPGGMGRELQGGGKPG